MSTRSVQKHERNPWRASSGRAVCGDASIYIYYTIIFLIRELYICLCICIYIYTLLGQDQSSLTEWGVDVLPYQWGRPHCHSRADQTLLQWACRPLVWTCRVVPWRLACSPPGVFHTHAEGFVVSACMYIGVCMSEGCIGVCLCVFTCIYMYMYACVYIRIYI